MIQCLRALGLVGPAAGFRNLAYDNMVYCTSKIVKTSVLHLPYWKALMWTELMDPTKDIRFCCCFRRRCCYCCLFCLLSLESDMLYVSDCSAAHNVSLSLDQLIKKVVCNGIWLNENVIFVWGTKVYVCVWSDKKHNCKTYFVDTRSITCMCSSTTTTLNYRNIHEIIW